MSAQCETTAKRAAGASIGFFERYLTLWVTLCIVTGIALGHWLPGTFQTVGRLELAQVNLPVAVLIWLMIIPMLLKVDFGALHRMKEHWKGIGVTLFINWAVKPFSMALLGWLFIRGVFAEYLPADQLDAYIAGLILLAAITLREPPPLPVTGETLLASLVTEEGDTRFVVLYDSSANVLRASLVEGTAPAERDYELWFVPPGNSGAPVSLGIVGGEGDKAPHVPATLLGDFTDGTTIAVSLEPAGGSPTCQATGPVVAVAPAKKI